METPTGGRRGSHEECIGNPRSCVSSYALQTAYLHVLQRRHLFGSGLLAPNRSRCGPSRLWYAQRPTLLGRSQLVGHRVGPRRLLPPPPWCQPVRYRQSRCLPCRLINFFPKTSPLTLGCKTRRVTFIIFLFQLFLFIINKTVSSRTVSLRLPYIDGGGIYFLSVLYLSLYMKNKIFSLVPAESILTSVLLFNKPMIFKWIRNVEIIQMTWCGVGPRWHYLYHWTDERVAQSMHSDHAAQFDGHRFLAISCNETH